MPALLADRVRTDGAGPLVTFYDDATGERTELSAITFDNWVAKTANLLVDGLSLGPGDDAVLALPVHWQSLVVAAGCWAAGLTVGFEGPADVAFTAEGQPPVAADEAVVLSLRPLGAGLT
ncbi:MAG: TIGR03089 family protein, partial [Mycobacteriales bacterium]